MAFDRWYTKEIWFYVVSLVGMRMRLEVFAFLPLVKSQQRVGSGQNCEEVRPSIPGRSSFSTLTLPYDGLPPLSVLFLLTASENLFSGDICRKTHEQTAVKVVIYSFYKEYWYFKLETRNHMSEEKNRNLLIAKC